MNVSQIKILKQKGGWQREWFKAYKNDFVGGADIAYDFDRIGRHGLSF